MSTKITLITPPDFYETGNLSILLAHLTDEEQTAVSDWLGKHDLNENINLYFYDNENNSTWFLYAANRCEYKYINIDYVNYITQSLSGHVLGKPGFYYRTDNSALAEVYAHINTRRVDTVEQFLESIFGDKQTTNN